MVKACRNFAQIRKIDTLILDQKSSRGVNCAIRVSKYAQGQCDAKFRSPGMKRSGVTQTFIQRNSGCG